MLFVANAPMETPDAALARLESEFDRLEASNAFAILRVESGASAREIRKAYVSAAKTFHPHLGPRSR